MKVCRVHFYINEMNRRQYKLYMNTTFLQQLSFWKPSNGAFKKISKRLLSFYLIEVFTLRRLCLHPSSKLR